MYFFKVTFLISVVVVLRLTVWIQPEEKKTYRFNAGVAVFIYWLRHSSEVMWGHRATRGFRFWSFVHIFSHCSLLQSWIGVFAACMTSLWHLGECLSPSSANCWLFFFLSILWLCSPTASQHSHCLLPSFSDSSDVLFFFSPVSLNVVIFRTLTFRRASLQVQCVESQLALCCSVRAVGLDSL